MTKPSDNHPKDTLKFINAANNPSLTQEIRYKDDADFDSKLISITEHVENHIGAVSDILREFPVAKLSILIIRPTVEKPFFTLITCGLSETPMDQVDPNDPHRLCELMISLPKEWPFPESDAEGNYQADDKTFFPLNLLINLVNYGRQSRAFWLGNTMTGKPEEFYPKIKSYFLDLPILPISSPEDFIMLSNESQTESIFFIGVYPLYEDEYKFKLQHGPEALSEKLDQSKVTLIFNSERKSAVKKSFFDIF